MAIQTKTSGYFNTLVSSISGSEHPLMLLTINHSTLGTPIRFVNNNENITSNGNLFYGASFQLPLPNQPQDGLPGTNITLPNTGDKSMTDFIAGIKGQGVSCTIQVILPSAPDTIEYQITLDASAFVLTKKTISARLSAPNYYNEQWSAILYGPKYSPAAI